MRILLAAAVVLLVVPGAAAKDFRPGDLRICNASRCVPITDSRILPLVGTFYYHSGSPPAASPPRMGASMFELRFRNGYVTGIVATARLDRFLSYGVDLERFDKGRWYRVPARLAAELRRLAAPLRPLRVTASALARSH